MSTLYVVEIPNEIPALQSTTDLKQAAPAKPFRQKGRKKYMSKRSGQSGQVFLRNDRWIGRFYIDVVGQTARVRKAVVLGTKRELTKTAAELKLKNKIWEEGVNTPEHLESSLLPPQPAPTPATFNDVADEWELKRLPKLKESSRYAYPKLIAKHLRPFLGAMALEDIKTENVNDWIADLERKELEPKTIHNVWKMFRAIMNWRAKQKDQQSRKWYPELPSIPRTQQRWFTQTEIRRLVEAAEGQYKMLFHLAGTSGLRAGELFGLHVEDLNFAEGWIRVERSVWRGQEVTPKTENSYRVVFVDSTTIQMLKNHLGNRSTGRVFETRNGTPLETHNVVRQVLKPLCRQIGIAVGGMHAFRHGRVSHLQQSGVPADFTKSQVGHSSLRTTSLYTHFGEDFVRKTVEKMASELPSWTHSRKLDSVEVAAN